MSDAGIAAVLDELPRFTQPGLCRYESEPEIFSGATPDDIEDAKAICRRCPVAAECLSTALDRREPEGVWGGLSAKERAQLAGPVESPPARFEVQRQAGMTLLRAGRSVAAVVDLLEVSERTVLRWRTAVRKEGAPA